MSFSLVSAVYAQESPSSPSDVINPEELPVPEVEDDRLNKIIRGLISNIRSLPSDLGGSIRRIMSLLRQLFIILGEYFGLIDEQIKSSECHDRACESHGNNPPQPAP